LLCAAAVQHALRHLGGDKPTRDDEHGFRLMPAAAVWLFPRLRGWAGPYYGEWCAAFDNA
jgi:hypothetical protein